MSTPRTLEVVLQSTSENPFPDLLGEAKVTIGSTDCDGDTPLHVLIWRDNVEGVLLLIGHGANANALGIWEKHRFTLPYHVTNRK